MRGACSWGCRAGNKFGRRARGRRECVCRDAISFGVLLARVSGGGGMLSCNVIAFVELSVACRKGASSRACCSSLSRGFISVRSLARACRVVRPSTPPVWRSRGRSCRAARACFFDDWRRRCSRASAAGSSVVGAPHSSRHESRVMFVRGGVSPSIGHGVRLGGAVEASLKRRIIQQHIIQQHISPMVYIREHRGLV